MSTIYLYLKKHLFQRRFFYLILCTALVCPMLLLTGCQNATGSDTATGKKPISINSIKLNTAVQITIYDSQDKSLLDDCLALCDKYELVFSRTNEKSELYKLNHRKNTSDKDPNADGQTTPYPVSGTADTWHISEDLASLLSQGLSITRESDGAFDIAIAPLTSLWDFTAEDPKAPDDADIQKVLPLCSSDGVTIDGQDITLPSDDIQFDVGAIAKGYIADRIKDYLEEQGVKHATINLGGNIQTIGTKPDGSDYNIGIQKPFDETGEPITSVKIKDKSIVTTGIYQRYFEQDGTLYHHVLDPRTGMPCDTDLYSVSIITDSSLTADAMSTVCCLMGYQESMNVISQLDNVDAVFVTDDGNIKYSSNFQKKQPK